MVEVILEVVVALEVVVLEVVQLLEDDVARWRLNTLRLFNVLLILRLLQL